MADVVGEAGVDPGLPDPNLAGEEVVAGEPCAPARLHLGDEVVVNLRLEPLQPRDVLRPLGAERVEQALVLAGGVDPALDAVRGRSGPESRRTRRSPRSSR